MTINQLKVNDKKKWLSINPKIEFYDVNKSFYKNHYYKIVLTIPNSSTPIWFIKSYLRKEQNNPPNAKRFYSELRKTLVNRQQWLNGFSTQFFGSAAREFDFDLLYDLGQFVYRLNNTVKHRVEGSRIGFFFKNEDDANQFIDALSGMLIKRVYSIHRPANNAAKQIIERGSVILKSRIPQKYFVTLKAGFYKQQECKALLEYLNSINARCTAYLKERLLEVDDQKYFSEIRFYIHEETEAMWVQLIMGNKLTKIAKVEYLD